MKLTRLLLLLISATFFFDGFTQNLVLQQSHSYGIYNKDERIQVKLFVKNNQGDTISVKIRENYQEPISQKLFFQGDSLVIFEKTCHRPASLIFEASTKTESTSIGLVVEPQELKPGFERPKDFDRFWKSEKKVLRALPMDVKAEPVSETVKGYSCFNMKINCTGPKSVVGYFAKPESAKDRSLPIVLFLHAAGVKGFWCRSTPGNALYYAKMKALCFDLNAHGMLNNQSDQYYAGLENGELKDYPFQGIGNKQDFYFRGMYLRLIRTLDFLTQQPEWDGKRILVIGQSQGGGQALAAAGLDNRVTAVVATLPAMCDWGGNLVGRKGGWPNPMGTSEPKEKLQVLPYFDTASLLKGIKSKIFAEIGLIDNTCPATSVYAALNQAKGEKVIIPVPYLGHSDVPASYQNTWKENVEKKRMEFITEFLK